MPDMLQHMKEHRKRYHPGRWGDWHWSAHDYCLNLVPERNGWTIDNPFYYIWFYKKGTRTIDNKNDVYFWIKQISGKNKELYGERCLQDLMIAFDNILRHSQLRDALEWDAEKVAKAYSKHVRLHKRGGISKKLRFEILERDRYTCQLCGAKAPEAPLHIDHKHPKSKGGKTVVGNLWTLCQDCNLGKSDRIIEF